MPYGSFCCGVLRDGYAPLLIIGLALVDGGFVLTPESPDESTGKFDGTGGVMEGELKPDNELIESASLSIGGMD